MLDLWHRRNEWRCSESFEQLHDHC
jgi:hypothetical protein